MLEFKKEYKPFVLSVLLIPVLFIAGSHASAVPAFSSTGGEDLVKESQAEEEKVLSDTLFYPDTSPLLQASPSKSDPQPQLEPTSNPVSPTKDSLPDTSSSVMDLQGPPQLEIPHVVDPDQVHGDRLTLRDCLEWSIRVSLPREIADKRFSFDTWNYAVAIRTLFPELTFNFNAEEGTLSQTFYKSRSFNFEIKQPLFRGFSLVNKVLQEKYNRRASSEEIKKALDEATHDVLIAYFELSRLDSIYQNHKELHGELEKQFRQSEDKMKQGVISEIEYLNVKYLYSELMHDEALRWNDREIAALELKKVLRLPPQEKINIAPLYNYDSYNPKSLENFAEGVTQKSQDLHMGNSQTLDSFILLAYKNRPDMKLEENKLIANRYAEKAARGGWLPTSDLVMKLGKTSQEALPTDGPSPYNPDFSVNVVTGWNLGGNTVKHAFDSSQAAPSVTAFQGAGGTTKQLHTFSAQILDGLKQYADVRQAQLQTLEQLKIYEDTERQAVQEVTEAYYRYRAAVIRLNSAAAGLDFRKRSLDLSKFKLENNEIAASEYLESLKEFAGQRDEFHTTMADYFSSRATLNHAVGIQNFIPIEDFVDFTSPASPVTQQRTK